MSNSMIFCHGCGKEVHESAISCPQCGAKQGKSTSENVNWFLEALKKYAVFEGRARRKEYWFFILFTFICVFVFSFIDALTGNLNEDIGLGLFSGIFCLAIFIPSISVTVRRLHDTNRSGGWWFLYFIPFIGSIVIFVFSVLDGTSGPNDYGPDPKA